MNRKLLTLCFSCLLGTFPIHPAQADDLVTTVPDCVTALMKQKNFTSLDDFKHVRDKTEFLVNGRDLKLYKDEMPEELCRQAIPSPTELDTIAKLNAEIARRNVVLIQNATQLQKAEQRVDAAERDVKSLRNDSIIRMAVRNPLLAKISYCIPWVALFLTVIVISFWGPISGWLRRMKSRKTWRYARAGNWARFTAATGLPYLRLGIGPRYRR